MADLATQQAEYDKLKTALDALKGVPGMETVYKQMLDDFTTKYPKGRPVELTDTEAAQGLAAAGVNLGIGEALLADKTYGPELRKVFDLYKAGKTTEALDALYKSKFGKLDPTARNRYVTKLENTDLYKKNLNSWLINVKQKLKQQGTPVDDAKLQDYYIRGIEDNVILDEALSGAKFAPGKTGGTQATSYNDLLKIATRNGVSASMLPKVLGYDTIDQALADLQRGESIDVFNQKIRNYAKTAMPDYVKKLIDEGNDLTDIVAPYKSTIADVLELPYDSVDVTDKYIQNALASNMSLTDLRKALRKDDRWQYTDQANKEASNLATTVLRDFGFMG